MARLSGEIYRLDRMEISLQVIFLLCLAVSSLQETLPNPRLIVHPLNGEACIGFTITLTCLVDDEDTSRWEYLWYKDKTDSAMAQMDWSNENSYSVMHAVLETSGQYWCKARIKSSSILTNLSNPVTVKITDVLITRVSLNTSPRMPLVEGDRFNLTCLATLSKNASCNLVYNITKDNEIIMNVYWNESSFRHSNPQVAKSDAGNYNCYVNTYVSKQSTASQVVKVIVEDLFTNVVLKRTYEGELVMENESIDFNCIAAVHRLRVAHTKMNYLFLHPGSLSTFSNTPNLRIARTNHSHVGNHRCAAVSASVMRYSPDVSLQLYDPFPEARLTVMPLDGKGYNNDTIILKCDLDHYVGWRYYWYKVRPDSNPVHQSMSSIGNGAAYRIQKASERDSGPYWCRSGRGTPTFYTKYSQLVYVNVTDLFKSVNLTAHPGTVVREGHLLQLICKAEFNEKLLPDSANLRIRYTFWKNGISLGSFPDSGIYNIFEMKSSHAGEYVCSCSNISGRGEKFSNKIDIAFYDSAVKLPLAFMLIIFLLLIPFLVFLCTRVWGLLSRSSKEETQYNFSEEDMALNPSSKGYFQQDNVPCERICIISDWFHKYDEQVIKSLYANGLSHQISNQQSKVVE